MDYATLATYDNTDYTDVNSYRAMTKNPVAASTSPEEETIILQNKFGTFWFEPEDCIKLHQGLIGLTDYTRFALTAIPKTGEGNNFRLLQSLEEAHLSFIVFPTTAENSLLEAQDVASLCNNFSIAEANLVLLHIVTVREMFGKIQMTLNVKAPIIVDSSKRTAQQYVLPSNKYAVQVPLAA
jgi:flagellar assembly factor FliW